MGAETGKQNWNALTYVFRMGQIRMSRVSSFFFDIVVFCVKRRSTIEVDPNFSKAPHLRSSIPHPNTDVSKKINCTPMNNSMAQVSI